MNETHSQDADRAGDVVGTRSKEAGATEDARRGWVVLAWDFSRAILVSSILVGMGLIVSMEFMRWLDYFEPRLEHILGTESWQPFLQGCTEVSDAVQNMDDGSIVFLIRPEFDDWERFIETVTSDAKRIGWVKVDELDEYVREGKTGYAVKSRVDKLLRKNSSSSVPVHNYFKLAHDPEESAWRSADVVEYTLLDESGTVMFVCVYR